MNTYLFRYRTSDNEVYLHVKYEARNLASALKAFWADSTDFASPVVKLIRSYEVINSKGKTSFRFLKDNIKVYPHEIYS